VVVDFKTLENKLLSLKSTHLPQNTKSNTHLIICDQGR